MNTPTTPAELRVSGLATLHELSTLQKPETEQLFFAFLKSHFMGVFESIKHNQPTPADIEVMKWLHALLREVKRELEIYNQGPLVRGHAVATDLKPEPARDTQRAELLVAGRSVS